ncbi:MAG TPA: hypothetical protein VGA52_04140 [Anaerolineales bacterium]|jgi:hypothetical protein
MAAKRSSVTRKQLEALLAEALVPVEPSGRFVRRLRARLVRYEGSRASTLWAIVAGLAIALIVIIAGFSVALRLSLGLLSVLGLLDRRPSSPEGQQAAA